MINFIKGNITIGEKNLSVATNYNDLSVLANENLLEKREDAGGIYYYLETETDEMRFAAFVSLRNKKIEWILLRWLDRLCKSWDDASEEAMIDEYHLLSDFVKKNIGAAPDKKSTGTRSWRLKWGQLDVSYEIRSYDVAIFMKPK